MESEKFVPEDFDASEWGNIEPYVNDLLNRNLSCTGCLEGLIADASSLAEHISETGALLYIGMTCDTENDEKRDSFLDFVENVRPKLSEFSDSLNRRIVEHTSIDDMSPRYDLMIKGMKNDIEIFRKENIPLGVEQTKLVTEAQAINGAMTVNFDGEERTMPQMRGYMESNLRAVLYEACISVTERRAVESESRS